MSGSSLQQHLRQTERKAFLWGQFGLALGALAAGLISYFYRRPGAENPFAHPMIQVPIIIAGAAVGLALGTWLWRDSFRLGRIISSQLVATVPIVVASVLVLRGTGDLSTSLLNAGLAALVIGTLRGWLQWREQRWYARLAADLMAIAPEPSIDHHRSGGE